jgi:hypothetical protein
LDLGNDAAGLLGATERNQNLIQDDVIEHGETGGAQAIGEEFCLATIALDHIPQSYAAERTHRGPQLDSAGAPGGIRRILPGLASALCVR